MKLRPGTTSDANAIAELIGSFQSELTDHPNGAGAEQFLASVSSEAERSYLESERYSYIVAERDGAENEAQPCIRAEAQRPRPM